MKTTKTTTVAMMMAVIVTLCMSAAGCTTESQRTSFFWNQKFETGFIHEEAPSHPSPDGFIKLQSPLFEEFARSKFAVQNALVSQGGVESQTSNAEYAVFKAQLHADYLRRIVEERLSTRFHSPMFEDFARSRFESRTIESDYNEFKLQLAIDLQALNDAEKKSVTDDANEESAKTNANDEN